MITFPQAMRYVSLALALVCVAMTAADFWNMASHNLKVSVALGAACTSVNLALAKLWGIAARSDAGETVEG